MSVICNGIVMVEATVMLVCGSDVSVLMVVVMVVLVC